MNMSIVPADRVMVVDGESLIFDYDIDPDIHAIQWHESHGHVEYKDSNRLNKELTIVDYKNIIVPFYNLFKAESDKKEALKKEEYVREFPSLVRRIRDGKLKECDYILAPDYPVSDNTREQWEVYRKALRDITELPGFPWNSLEEVPWPKAPTSTH